MTRIIIHIGSGKTGTKFLQQAFGRLPDVRSIGRPNHLNEQYDHFFRHLTGDYADEQAAKVIQQFISGPSGADPRTVILSDEKISAAPSQHAIARRLAMATKARADILITARNQVDAIKSHYGNHGRILKDAPRAFSGQHVSFNDWFDFALERSESSYLRRINYAQVAQIYEEYLPGRVTVLLFEDMVNRRDLFAARIAGLIGVDAGPFLEPYEAVNMRETDKRVTYQRIRTKFAMGRSLVGRIPGHQFLRAQFNRFLDRGPGHDVDIDPVRMRKIEELYGASNRALSKRLQVDLQDYGYPGLKSFRSSAPLQSKRRPMSVA